ncbi:transcription initiation factor TFIID subunit 11 [Tripterygium wilfordii]|uniref:Transcription initiation factor TFIID subunit 11 n=1 Tax=Tripterygium wilfordii TaxID=458696 RepID=A0A7J7CHS8_TRIWF|nr:transcription initiation factor TFIID subunit 11 [Tripterygium wilfordii]XP_038680161.1 transcription initiation factor TFIID subunit 11 [Tripterygium wilfordii]XP_038680162.1 transcription initiation factor TFIID subunit 11 [Tripterygium wilfordii]KAF5733591.1 transcription initiation factor TFIID subunit 11 [Tripterygium wilfordii]
MKQSKDPFEAAYDEQEESPPESPIAQEGSEAQTGGVGAAAHGREDDDDTRGAHRPNISTSAPRAIASTSTKNKEDDDEEEEENVEVELSKFPSSADPTKMARMQSILSQFTDEQMSRYESFRRSALQKSNMRRLLVSVTGSQKISLPMTIAVCGIAKLFVGELVETARVVMTERKDSGPIRPCHIREAYRRLKLDGKVPKRSAPRLFR